jgi:hypothetical protein
MAGGTVCWLHQNGDEHVAAQPVGVRTSRGDVIPADMLCARWAVDADELDPDQVVDASEVTVGWVRS